MYGEYVQLFIKKYTYVNIWPLLSTDGIVYKQITEFLDKKLQIKAFRHFIKIYEFLINLKMPFKSIMVHSESLKDEQFVLIALNGQFFPPIFKII